VQHGTQQQQRARQGAGQGPTQDTDQGFFSQQLKGEQRSNGVKNGPTLPIIADTGGRFFGRALALRRPSV